VVGQPHKELGVVAATPGSLVDWGGWSLIRFQIFGFIFIFIFNNLSFYF
jgi:hypothetical protein